MAERKWPDMESLTSLFAAYENLVFLDTETTGLDPKTDRVIEVAMIRLSKKDGILEENRYQTFIRLPDDWNLPVPITNLTGITEQTLRDHGIPEQTCVAVLEHLLSGKTLLIGHNLQFDYQFLQAMFVRIGRPEEGNALENCALLDTCTVLRDRKDGRHRLSDGLEYYHLETIAVNSHRALDDTSALVYLLDAMAGEKEDLLSYVDRIGYNPAYGYPRDTIFGVCYFEQGQRESVTRTVMNRHTR